MPKAAGACRASCLERRQAGWDSTTRASETGNQTDTSRATAPSEDGHPTVSMDGLLDRTLNVSVR